MDKPTPDQPDPGTVLLVAVTRALLLTVLAMLAAGNLGWPALGFADLLPAGALLAVWPGTGS